MPTVTLDLHTKARWEGYLAEEQEKEPPREGMHVSDLTLCLRQGELMREYIPNWTYETLYMFTLGRAFEKAVFQLIMPHLDKATQELEVTADGIEGHIDFGADPYDYECKLSWTAPPETPADLFEQKFWWLEQAGSYAAMRGRTACKFAVLYIPKWPQPELNIYHVEWTLTELAELWEMMQGRKKHVLKRREEGRLPGKTPLTWLCTNCPVKSVCDKRG